MAKHTFMLATPFRKALYLHMRDGGWLIITVVALLSIIWVRSRRRGSRITPSPDPSQNSVLRRKEHTVPTPRDNEANRARGPLILVAETVPKSPASPAETERDQMLATCMNLRAEISECNTLNDRLRNRLNSKDVKISKLQIQIMENPTREILELQLETKETTIASLKRQLQTLKEDYESISRAQQESLKGQNRRDESYASTIADLKDAYNDKVEANRLKHQIDMHQLDMRCDARINESNQRATEAFSQCGKLEAKIVELHASHDNLVQREQQRELERESEQNECFDEVRLARESEFAARDQLKHLKEMVDTRDENIKSLEEMIKTRDENIEDLKRTSTEQQNQQEHIVSLARIDGRLEAATALKVYMKLARKARTRMRSEIKTLQDDVANKTAEIQASEASFAEALDLALESQRNVPKTSSVELDAALNELTECQTRSKKIQSDWEAAHKQVSELVQLLCEKESHMRDKNAELEVEREYAIDLEKKLALAQGRADRVEEKQRDLQKMEEQAIPIESSRTHHNTLREPSPLLPVSMQDNQTTNRTTSKRVDVMEVPKTRHSAIHGTGVSVANTNIPIINRDTNAKKVRFTHDTSVDKNINRLGDSLSTSQWANAYASKVINQVRTIGGRNDNGRVYRPESRNPLTKPQHITKGSKQPPAQLPQWLIDSMKGNVVKEKSKDTVDNVTSPQENIRESEGGRKTGGNRSQQDGSKRSPPQPKEEGKMSQSLSTSQQQQMANDAARAPGQFPQWLIDAQKQIEEEVQKETDYELASAQENLRKYEGLHGKIDDRFQKDGSQKKPMSV